MARSYDYQCSQCHRRPGRDKLVVKKATFVEMGLGSKVVRSRVVGWLCDLCLNEDPHYNQPPFKTQEVVGG